MDTFYLTILEDRKIHYSGEASSCRITTPSGEIGFLARHENFIGTIEPSSEIRYTGRSGSESAIRAASGVLMFSDNRCTITLSGEQEG